MGTILTKEDEQRPFNMRIGGPRAEIHRVDKLDVEIGPTGKGSLTFLKTVDVKVVTIYMSPEGTEQLLRQILGKLPALHDFGDQEIVQLARMIVGRKDETPLQEARKVAREMFRYFMSDYEGVQNHQIEQLLEKYPWLQRGEEGKGQV